MAIMRLIPSTYYLSNSSYLAITDASNMYANTDSTNYATIQNKQTGTTSYYLYIRGFNFDAIPSDVIINSFTIKFKAKEKGVSTSTSYRPYLCNNTTTITGSCSVVNTSEQVLAFTGVTADWDTIKGYGSNFGIRINCRRNNRNTVGYMYVYGAEIEVDYTIPVYHDIATSCTGGTIVPDSVNLLEGSSQTFKIQGATGKEELSSLTYNGSNVLSQAVRKAIGSDLVFEVTPVSGASYGFALNGNYYVSQNKGKAGSAALCKINFDLPVECTVDFYVINYAEATYDYGLLGNIDQTLSTSASADSNVYWTGRDDNSQYEQKVSYTMPSGEHFITAKYFKDNYTDSNNDTLQFRVEITPNEEIRSDEFYYEFTVTNINADGVLVAIFGDTPQPAEQVYVKENGAWVPCSEVFKKVNGAWVEQTDLSTVFNESTNYVKAN